MKTTKEPTVTIELTEDEQRLFLEFRRRINVIAPIIGYLDSFNRFDLCNTNISLDLDKEGIIKHTVITKHYRFE